jgi:PatG C-terminal
MTMNEVHEDRQPVRVEPAESQGASTAAPVAPPAERVAEAPLPSFVFALGSVEPRFPSLSVEKEFAQVVGRSDNGGLTDREALASTIADRGNRYLARNICWVFLIGGLETYLLTPRDPADLDLLIEAARPRPAPGDIDLVVGTRGSIASPEMCNGLALPIVVFDQLYSFGRQELIDAIPRPEDVEADEFEASAGELLDRLLQIGDNAGATDEHRALNYCAARYSAIYELAARAHAEDASLSEVTTRPSRLSGARKIVDVVFSFTNRRTDVTEKYFVRVDVTEQFPFLVTKLSPYFER